MDQTQLEAILGRPLTQREIDNLDIYLEIAEDSLGELLCTDIKRMDGKTRTFKSRAGYRTVWTGIFRSIQEVKVSGKAVSDYTIAQNDNSYGGWYNSIIFNKSVKGTIEIRANWGFETYPNDLQLLLAQLFANISKKYSTDGKITNKRVEDFSISFDGSKTDDQSFIDENIRIINKYSVCNVIDLINGKTGSDCGC